MPPLPPPSIPSPSHTVPPPPSSTAPSSTPVPATAGYSHTIPLLPPSGIPPELFDYAVGCAVDCAVRHVVNDAVNRAVDRAIDDIYDLHVGRQEWSKHGTVRLTSVQHAMLSKTSPSQWKGFGPIDMELLDLSGRLCFTQHCGDSPASSFVENLLRVTQDMAGKTQEGSSLYWNHSVVLFLNKRVKVEVDGKSHSGLFVGATTLETPGGPPLPFGVYRIQLSGSTELILDLLKSGIDGTWIQELSETANETVDNEGFEEMTDC
ncbi:hypothetical protein BM1_10013 [Bipolaris maydis]|nr:hypothetical protein BM1_10013 [Bipolaris maydis]